MQPDAIAASSSPRSMDGAAEARLVTIIIPSLHRPDLLRQCLASLDRLSVASHDYEVVVIENEARPDCMLAPPLPANVRCIALEKNLGTTGSVNCGLRQSRSEYVLVLNNDVELDSRYLEVLIGALRSNPALALATGKLMNGRQAGVLDGAGDAVLRGMGAYRLGHAGTDRGQFDQVTSVLIGCGAATLYRRCALDLIGGLDEDFFAYLDDVDLGLRFHLAGYRGIYIPDAVAWHLGSATLGDSFHPRIVELLTRNQLFLLLKDCPTGTLLRLAPQVIVFQMLWLVFVIRNKRISAWLRGLAGALVRTPRMLAKRRRVMRSRRITSREFNALLSASERQISQWQLGLAESARSQLLSAYFRLFPSAKHGSSRGTPPWACGP
jgi:GT2 family glycosyltransferase